MRDIEELIQMNKNSLVTALELVSTDIASIAQDIKSKETINDEDIERVRMRVSGSAKLIRQKIKTLTKNKKKSEL